TELASKAGSAPTPRKKTPSKANQSPGAPSITPTKASAANPSPLKFSGFSAKPDSSPAPSSSSGSSLSTAQCDPKHKDCLLREFRKLCAMVAEQASYNTKTQIIHDFLTKGTGGGRTYCEVDHII
ncbi:hypothetical protein GDO78_020399, partial [Eleutherodactylus coqui]